MPCPRATNQSHLTRPFQRTQGNWSKTYERTRSIQTWAITVTKEGRVHCFMTLLNDNSLIICMIMFIAVLTWRSY